MRSKKWSVALAIVMTFVLASQAVATHWEPGYQNYGRGSTTKCRVSGDRFTSYAYVRWTSTEANNLRSTASGYNVRYTQDMRDGNDNVHADGYWTSNFPSPAFDRENDAGFPVTETKHEEAEVTATSSSFPTAGTTYYFSARYSHWWGSDPCGPNGDNGGGNIGHNEHMSQYSFGEWNTYNFAYSGTKNVSYPYVCVVGSCPASAPLDSEFEGIAVSDRPAVSVEKGNRAKEMRVPAGSPFRVFDDGQGAFVDPDLSAGLEEYRRGIHEVGRAFLSGGKRAQAVITFTRPISAQDLAEIAGNEIDILTIEAVGLDGAGQRFSGGAPYSADVWPQLVEFANETVDGATLDGIVAAEVELAGRSEFDRAAADPRVFVIDLAAAIAMQASRSSEVPSLNDLYWYLAGWEPLD